MNDEDYLPDEALAKIEANVPKMAQDFELDINNAWAKSVQAHFKWRSPDDVYRRADSIYALVEGAMCVDTLCKNLRAEREKQAFALDFWQVAYALGRALDNDDPGSYFWSVVVELKKPYPNFDWANVMTDGPAGVPYEETEQLPSDQMLVPRSFVESVLYSGSFEAEDLDRLHRQAEELLG